MYYNVVLRLDGSQLSAYISEVRRKFYHPSNYMLAWSYGRRRNADTLAEYLVGRFSGGAWASFLVIGFCLHLLRVERNVPGGG